jgi:hypothetical protein
MNDFDWKLIPGPHEAYMASQVTLFYAQLTLGTVLLGLFVMAKGMGHFERKHKWYQLSLRDVLLACLVFGLALKSLVAVDWPHFAASVRLWL